MKRISELEKHYVNDVLDGGFESTINGKYNALLEKAFSQSFSMPYAIGHVNGTATMHTALVALNLPKGSKVIVPPLTMASTSLAVLHAGHIPVYADVDLNTWQISIASIREVYREDVKAIITVALYGNCPEYDEILAFCAEKSIYLIEDNAENFLGTYKNKLVGSFGDFASFSFQASKHMTTGEGGMLLCKDEDFALAARRFTSLGYAGISKNVSKISKEDIQRPHYKRHVSIGMNYRMSELQAACALGQLERLKELVNRCVYVANRYYEIISSYDHFLPMKIADNVGATYWGFPFVISDAKAYLWEEFYKAYKAKSGRGFYAAWELTYLEPLFQDKIQFFNGVDQKYALGLCPNAESLQRRIVALPTNIWCDAELESNISALRKAIDEVF